VRLVFRGPTIDEQTCRDKKSTRDHHGNTVLWSSGTAVAAFQAGINTILEGCANLGTKEESKTE
jgi:hypothetical protein